MFKLTDKLLEDLIERRRYLHRNPELAFEEFNTTEHLKKWLETHGITILPFDLETGVIAEVKGEHEGPIIAIRSDIDALPIKEKTDIPYRSEIDGKMHACGHDFHSVSILGAAILLNEQKDQLYGTVRFIFQPAEEVAQGAKYLVDKGVLNDVKAIFGMHNKPDLPVGTIGVKSNGLMASVDKFEMTFNGIGGHAGIPHSTIDPIVMASQYVNNVQSIIARRIDLFHNAVISITSINGGSTWNVIPDKVVLQGTVRTFQQEARETIEIYMKKLAQTTAEGHGGAVDFQWESYLPVVNNSGEYEKVMRDAVKEAGYDVVDAIPNAGGEDFAYYLNYIPGFFVWMGVDGPKEWHHPEFDLKEDAIKVAAEYFATLAVKVLKN